MAEFFLNEIIFSSALITWLFFIIAYAILGGGIKFIDDAFDEKTFKLRNAILLAPLLGIFWAYLMTLSPASATILGAVVIAVFLKGKIDNIAHQLGILSIFFVLFIFGFLHFLWIPLVILVIGGLIDEFGNDFVDRRLNTPAPLYLFFEYRFFLKLVILGFVIFMPLEFPLYLFFAFLAFDIAYALVMKISDNIGHNRKFFYHKNGNGLLGKVFFNEKG